MWQQCDNWLPSYGNEDALRGNKIRNDSLPPKNIPPESKKGVDLMSNLRYFRISFLPKLAVLLALGLFSLAPMASATTVNCSGVAAWSGNSVAYAVNALVTYNGSEYKCLTAHTSNVSWDPVDAA